MRKVRPWLMLILALGSGGLAAYLALRYLREQATPLMASEPRKVSVVLAARSMPIGAVVTEQDVKVVGWPGDALPTGYITSIADALGRGVITPVAENEPLLVSKVSTKDQGGGLSIIIKEGMRAMSVRVDEVIGVAGFVLPGTHVDVLLTLDKGENRTQTSTRTILQNVQVLAAGQQVQRDKEGKPQTVTVITLLVTLEDAELLVLAGKEGRIQLALRNGLDTLSLATAGAKADQLAPGGAPARAVRAASPNRSAPVSTPKFNATVIEGYRGGERTLTTFQKP
jgi:pilus assembly protein CpaB